MSGGKKKWSELHSLVLKTESVMIGNEDPGITVAYIKPNLFFIEHFSKKTGDFRASTLFDGKEIWQKIGEGKLFKNDLFKEQYFKNQDNRFGIFFFQIRLLNYKEQGYEIEFIETKKLEEKEYYVLRLKNSTFNENLYFNKNTGLIDFSESSQFKTTLSDYREVSGLLIPFYSEAYYQGIFNSSEKFIDIKLNQTIDDSLFMSDKK